MKFSEIDIQPSYYLEMLTHQLMVQKEKILTQQLGDLVKRGLLVCEETEPFLIKDPRNPNEFTLVQQVKLDLKDKEYILKLEDENRILKAKIEQLKKVFNET